MNDAAATAERAIKLANKAKRLFAGKGPDVTGAALCELVALHLAGHIVPDNEEETRQVREGLLEAFVETVRQLVPVLEAMEIRPRLKEMQARRRPK